MSRPSEKIPAVGRSAKALPVVGLLSVGLAVATLLLGQRLGAERERTEALQSQVGRLQAANAALLAHAERQAIAGRLGPGLGARNPGLAAPAAGGAPLLAADTEGSGRPAGAVAGVASGPAGAYARGSNGLPARARADRSSALRDPAARDAMRRQQLAAMHRRYPDLAEALGLSRADADRFIEMQVDQQMRKIDEAQQLAAVGGARSSVEMKLTGERLAAAQRDADQALAGQFGPEVMQDWKSYQQGLGARTELRGLQLELIDAGMALSVGQRDSLVAAMVREQQVGAQAGSKKLTPEARIVQSEASYQRLQTAARAVLNAEQFARFDARQRQRLEVTTAATEATARSRNAAP